MSKYINDPRENVLRVENGIGYYLEEDNREEVENGNWYKWGAKILDLCDLPVDEYMKPMTVIVDGGGDDSGATKYDLTYYVNNVSKKTIYLKENDIIPEYDVSEVGYDVTPWADASGNTYTRMPANKLNLYCTKTIKTFEVKYIIDNELISSYMADYNSLPKNVPSTVKSGYTFNGWQPSTANTRITANTDFVGSYTKDTTATDFYYGFKLNSELSGSLVGIESGLTSKNISQHNSDIPFAVQVKSIYDYGQEVADEWLDLYETDDEYTENWDKDYAYSIVVLVPSEKTITSYKQGTDEAPNWAGSSTFETNYGTVLIDENTYKIFGYRNARAGYIVNDSDIPKQILIEIR